jgi:hypothetical protein
MVCVQAQPAAAICRAMATAGILASLHVLLALGAGSYALAQGQESVVAPMGPQTSARPPPLSQATVTATPSGQPVEPLPIPVARPEERGGGLVLPGQVRIAVQRLACGDIGDANARARCEALRTPPAPPAEARP